MRRKKKIIQDVEIIDIADKGNALGRTPEGEIILVAGAIPGDIIDTLILRKKKGLKFGRVAQTNVYSQYRTSSFCDHFGVCGGCKWQNLNYEKQAELKENAVKAAIRRIASDDEKKVKPIMAASITRYYRNKLEYAFSNKRWLTEKEINEGGQIENRHALGFHKAGAFDKVVDIAQCHLQEDLTNEIRNYIKEYAIEKSISFYDIRKNEGVLRNLIIKNTRDSQWMITLVFGAEGDIVPELMSVLQNQFPEVTSWHYIINEKKNDSIHDQDVIHFGGSEKIQEKLDHLKCLIGPKSFFQTNPYQAEVLYKKAAEYANLQGDEVVYDLYTGTGTIALYLAHQCRSVVGIEQIAEAIEDAHLNADLNQIENCNFLVGDVKDTLDLKFQETYGSPDLVITDPPRAGMHEDVVDTLLQLEAKKIVYISCNPSTQARDIKILKGKYELVECTPVDMFPHTSHIENVALLHLRNHEDF